MKTYPVYFQAGSQDENEDAQVPNRRRSRDVEVEGTTIGPDQTGPQGGYNQESTSQGAGGARGSRGQQAGEQYDRDDYEDRRDSVGRSGRYGSTYDDGARRTSGAAANSRSYGQPYSRGYASGGAAGASGQYAEGYDRRQMQAQRVSAEADMASSPFLQMQREIAERCLANAQRELADKEGAEFDMAFMGMQIVAHNRMLATLQAARQQASPQLARLIDEGIETTEQHLDHAREIAENLQRDENRSSSRDRRSERE